MQNLIRKRLPGAPGPAGKPSPHGQVGSAQERGGDHGSMPLPARLPGASGWCPSQGWLEGQAPLALQPLVPCAKVREVSWGRSRSQQCPREGQGHRTPGPGRQAAQVSVHAVCAAVQPQALLVPGGCSANTCGTRDGAQCTRDGAQSHARTRQGLLRHVFGATGHRLAQGHP